MKKENTLKQIAVIMLILVISLISFVGIYVKNLNRMENILPDYKLSMDFSNRKIVKLDVDTGYNTIYYDADKNIVDEEVEGGSKETVPVNSSESLTADNFSKVKEILKKRFEKLGAEEYYIRQDENGYMVIEMPDETKTDTILYVVRQTGEFLVKATDTKEVLLNNDDIEKSEVMYNTTEAGTTIYLGVQLKKESASKLEEISKTYVSTTDEEGKTDTKKVTISIDDETLAETYFGQTISNGVLQIAVGRVGTSSSTMNENYEQAKIYEVILNSGKLPVTYSLKDYGNTVENTQTQSIAQTAIALEIVTLFVLVVYFVARYKSAGIFAGIMQIGFIATLLLIIRYTNCVISANGMMAIVIISLFQAAFLNALLKNGKKSLKTSDADFKDTLFKYVKLEIPIDVMAVLYTFVAWTSISSMGMILFWGAVLFAAYNAIFTRTIMVKNNK